MNAYYERIKAPINNNEAMSIYVVHYEAIRGDGMTCGSVYKLIGAYDREETAMAVTNALKQGLIH